MEMLAALQSIPLHFEKLPNLAPHETLQKQVCYGYLLLRGLASDQITPL